MESSFTPMYKIVPEGTSGRASISHQVIDASTSEMTRLRAAINNRPEEFIPEGTYCRLFVRDELAMSDTAMEHGTNYEVIQKATGRVLIAGLGIGMILVPIAKKDDVTEIVVVEQSPDVIKLVYPHLVTYFKEKGTRHHKKYRVECADIHEWRPLATDQFDTIYFDIWATVWPDNLNEMVHLENKFRPLLTDTAKSWMGCWSRSIIEKTIGAY